MNILYSSSDSYSFLTGISMLSLLENNKTCKQIDIYIMDNKISNINKKKLTQIAVSYQRKLTFVIMPDIEKLTGHKINTKRWNISTFGRLYMASVLPKTIHRILNIDCDTIITDNIEELWNIDITDKVFGGMLECINDRYRRNVKMNNRDYYMNGGIVYLNLDEVRKYNYEQHFTDYIRKYGNSLAYLDQDVLNGVVNQNKKLKLPIRYNMLSIYFYTTYDQLLKIRRAEKNCFYDRAEFEAAKENPGIVHFTTCFLDGVRPWIKGNSHPYLQNFLNYKIMSPWSNLPLQKDSRNAILKIRSKIIKNIPRSFLCEIASLLHGVIIPSINYKKMSHISSLYLKNDRNNFSEDI